MTTKLDTVLRERLHLSDEEFARQCGQHRTEIWNYRTGRRVPSSPTANAILKALKKLGVPITLDQLLGE